MRRLPILLLLGLLFIPGTSQAQGEDVVWQVDYFGNGYLIHEPVHEETFRGRITKDWGTSSPGDDVPNDYFSARFSTTAYFSGGTWRFSALADDGVTIYVDYQPVIDTFEAGSPSQDVVGEVTLTEGYHQIQVDYREAEGAAFIYVNWSPAGTDASPAPFPEPSGAEITQGRWTAEYFNNTTLSPPRVFANDTPSPVANWGTDAPVDEVNPEAWSARFSRTQYLMAGRYRVTLRADDGVRFYFDGQLLVDQFGPVQGRAFEAEFYATEGEHDIVIEHVEYGGTALLNYSLARLTTDLETDNGTQPIPQPVIENNGTETDLAPAPTVTPSLPSTGVTATVTARYINVRAEPRVVRGNIVATASQGQQFPVVGRANNGWVQIEVNGVIGWVNGRYVNTPNIISLPITAEGPTE